MLYFVQWGVFSTVKSEVIFMELDAVLCAVRYFFSTVNSHGVYL